MILTIRIALINDFTIGMDIVKLFYSNNIYKMDFTIKKECIINYFALRTPVDKISQW